MRAMNPPDLQDLIVSTSSEINWELDKTGDADGAGGGVLLGNDGECPPQHNTTHLLDRFSSIEQYTHSLTHNASLDHPTHPTHPPHPPHPTLVHGHRAGTVATSPKKRFSGILLKGPKIVADETNPTQTQSDYSNIHSLQSTLGNP